MCQQQICPSNATYVQHMPITSCAHETTMTVYKSHLSYEIYAISNVTCSMGIHTSHSTDMCPRTNIPATLYTYMTHSTSSVVYIQTPHSAHINQK